MHTHHLQTRYAALVTTLVSNGWRITTNRDLFTEDCFSLYHCNSQELEPISLTRYLHHAMISSNYSYLVLLPYLDLLSNIRIPAKVTADMSKKLQ